MNITYKLASIQDIGIIREIAEKTWFTTYEPILGKEQPKYMFDLIYSYEGLEEQMIAGQIFVLQYALANQSEGTSPVAFASYSIKLGGKDTYKLNKLYLDPSLQGAGLGKKMIIEVEGQVKNIGGKWLELNVNRYNKARFFYEKMGFEIVAEEDIPIGDYFMNDYVMRKPL